MERYQRDSPEGYEEGEDLTTEERAEVRLYQNQERFRVAAKLRQIRHRDMILRLETEFAEQEDLEVLNRKEVFEKAIKVCTFENNYSYGSSTKMVIRMWALQK
jgi:hypothetical protein